MVDITTTTATIDSIVSILSRHFLIREWTCVGSYKQEFGKILGETCMKSSVVL